MHLLFININTTGLSWRMHYLLELAVVAYDDQSDRVLFAAHELCRGPSPECSLAWHPSAVYNHMRSGLLRDVQTERAVYPFAALSHLRAMVEESLEGDQAVAWAGASSASFDLPFLEAMFHRYDVPCAVSLLQRHVVDLTSMHYSRCLADQRSSLPTLEAIANELGFATHPNWVALRANRAINDAVLALACVRALQGRLLRSPEELLAGTGVVPVVN